MVMSGKVFRIGLIVTLLISAVVLAGCTTAAPSDESDQPQSEQNIASDSTNVEQEQVDTDAAGDPENSDPLPTSVPLDDLATHDGVPVGFTQEGFPFKGDPNAPVTINEFSDYLCPFCSRHFEQTWPTLRDQNILTGQAKYVFRDFPIPSLHPNAPAGHAAARCVGEQGADLYRAMHDELFANQNQWNQVADPSAYLATAAEAVGTNMDAYQDCVESGRTTEIVQAGMDTADELGFNGTPTFQFTANFMDTAYTLVGRVSVCGVPKLDQRTPTRRSAPPGGTGRG